VKLTQGTPEQVGLSRQKIDLVEKRAQEWVDEGITPALVLLVARRGTIVLHGAFGRTGPRSDAAKLDVSAIFPLASLTKVIAATSTMILVDDGLLGINRPVQDYIPEFVGERKENVMVHHLLTHTSGLVDKDVIAHQERNRGNVQIPPPEANEHPQLHEWLWLRFDAPLSKATGEQMSYSGVGYMLLAEIIRRVSGKNLADFAQERIFGPLGMNDTFYRLPGEVRGRLVDRASDLPDTFEDPGVADRPSGSVGGYSTAMDMAIFCQMFLNEGSYGSVQVLSPASVREMTRNQIPGVSSLFKEDFAPEASRGYGWDIKGNKKPRYHGSLDSPATFTHQGAGGVSIVVDPTYELVTVYFSVARGIMSPDRYRPEWAMDLFTNMVTAAVLDV
jgi:CubicO group peptidase (beta-lactamase class C family)